MTSSAKPPAQPPAKPPAKKKYGHWLSIGFFLLLVGGTFAARHLFLVDNDIEINTKFSGKSWQLNSRYLRQYLDATEQRVVKSMAPLGVTLQHQSTQAIDRVSAALSHPPNLCVSTAPISSVLDRLRPGNPSATTQPTPTKTPSTPTKTVATATTQSPNWCITTGVK